jgi:ABC-type multidrug transport system fused ATPase/permease subunit
MKQFEKIEFINVNFRYNKSPIVLKNININIKAGEIVGIVGESGAGKSTLINLILGELNPSGGIIKINNEISHNLRESLFGNLAYLSQNPLILNDNLISNITLSNENKLKNKEIIDKLIIDLDLIKLFSDDNIIKYKNLIINLFFYHFQKYLSN